MKIEIASDEIEVLKDLRKWMNGELDKPYQRIFNSQVRGWLDVVESILHRAIKEVGK